MSENKTSETGKESDDAELDKLISELEKGTEDSKKPKKPIIQQDGYDEYYESDSSMEETMENTFE